VSPKLVSEVNVTLEHRSDFRSSLSWAKDLRGEPLISLNQNFRSR
jgi:hypothetical protein